MKTTAYNDDSIKVLSDRDHIRERPTMYISVDRPSLQMFNEILDNALDEALNGYANRIIVSVDYDKDIVSVEDNGRGLPQGMNKDLDKPTIEVIYTKLNSGGKYGQSSYAISGGLNGVGSVVVNALSKYMTVHTWREESRVQAEFSEGKTIRFNRIISNVDPATPHGTYVEFQIDTDHKLFKEDRLSDYRKDIEDRLTLLKTLLPDLELVYNGKDVGSVSFDSFVFRSKEDLLDECITFNLKNLIFSFNWSEDTNKNRTRSYCNFIYNPNGGDHERGVWDAFYEYFDTKDSVLGMNLAISVMYPAVEYDSQAKLKASSKEMRTFVKESILSELKKYFKNNPEVKDRVLELIKRKRKDIDKRNNKGSVRRDRKSTFLSSLGVSGFSDCTTRDRETAELYICEGNSAAGSAIQARSVETQAILPIRGKIINAINSDVASLFKNAEVSTIMSSINAGTFDDVDIKNSRYDKIIIMADADEDGKNITCLLTSLFLTMTPELVEHGYLYIAFPPLYGTYVKKEWVPIYDEETKNKYLSRGYEVQRYKGLGEMNPTQLRIACMNPDTRRIIQIRTTEDCYEIVHNIMGGSSKYRKELLREVGVLID